MTDRTAFAAGCLSLALCAASCGPAKQGAKTTPNPPTPAGAVSVSDFTLDDVDGQAHSLSDYLGKNVILISFWATWCEPCKKEMDQLQTLYDAHKGAGLMILSISMDEPETQGDARPFVKQRGFTFPVLLDTETLVTNQLNPRRDAPFSLIIGRDQKISWEHVGYVPGDEKKVEAAVLEALGPAPQ